MVASTPRADSARGRNGDRRLDRRGADRKWVVGVASGVQDLQQDLCTRIVDRPGDSAVPSGLRRSDEFGGERQQPSGAVGRVATGDDQPDAAACTFGEVVGEPIDMAGPVFQSGVHRTHNHPVAQRGKPKVQRGQQIWVWICHRFSWSASATSSSQSMALSSARIPPRSTRY